MVLGRTVSQMVLDSALMNLQICRLRLTKTAPEPTKLVAKDSIRQLFPWKDILSSFFSQKKMYGYRLSHWLPTSELL